MRIKGEEHQKLDTIIKLSKPIGVSEELIFVYQEMERNLVYFQGSELKCVALKLLELENALQVFDDLI